MFRELISTDLTPQAIDGFTQLYWSFPDRQGKRANIDAKQVLAAGGKPKAARTRSRTWT